MTPAAIQSFRNAARTMRTALRADAVTYQNHQFNKGAVSVSPATLINADGGQTNGNILTWRIRKVDLSAKPEPKQILRYGDENWIIDEVSGIEVWKDEWTIKARQ